VLLRLPNKLLHYTLLRRFAEIGRQPAIRFSGGAERRPLQPPIRQRRTSVLQELLPLPERGREFLSNPLLGDQKGRYVGFWSVETVDSVAMHHRTLFPVPPRQASPSSS
jgi:hypothetical protein